MNRRGSTPIIVALVFVATVVIGGILYFRARPIKVQTSENLPSANVSSTTSFNTSAKTQTFPYSGASHAYPPFEIASIDPVKRTFEYHGCGPACQSEVDITYEVVPETLLEKDGRPIQFQDLAVGDQVFVRGISEGTSTILAKQVFIVSWWRSTSLIIDKVDLVNMILSGEAFIGDNQHQTIQLIPETEIRKGTAAQGSARPVVSLSDLKDGDIAGHIMEIERFDGSFVAVDIDIVSPYPCETYIKPRGCVE